MSMNKQDFYLQDIDLCKQLEPILKKKGIAEDAVRIINYVCYLCEYELLVNAYDNLIDEKHEESNLIKCPNCQGDLLIDRIPSITIPTYRKDSLEAALPEWCFRFNPVYEFTTHLYDSIDEILLAKNLPWPHWGEGSKGDFLLNECTDLLWIIHAQPGQKSLKALAELIILLDKEGLL